MEVERHWFRCLSTCRTGRSECGRPRSRREAEPLWHQAEGLSKANSARSGESPNDTGHTAGMEKAMGSIPNYNEGGQTKPSAGERPTPPLPVTRHTYKPLAVGDALGSEGEVSNPQPERTYAPDINTDASTLP